ncbi:MAG: DNA polymerase III subunit delta [Chloroflexi bacterium]|nr:DNA polymerase III subunit delta [Chloroflexota bacterium]
MFYILYGDDSFSIQGRLSEIRGRLGPPDAIVNNTSVFDGRRVSVGELTSACNTMPFLAEKRLVVVEGLLSRFEPAPGRGGRKAPVSAEVTKELTAWLPLADRVAVMPPTTALVLLDGALRGSNRLLAALKSKGEVCQFPLPKGPALHGWIQERVAKGGGTISPSAVRLLGDLAGGDLWALSNEIDKLALYSAGRTIEDGDVRSLVSNAQQANVFAMVDAVVARRPSAAISHLHRLMDQGAAPPYILSMITRQYRMLAQAKELTARASSPAEIGRQLGLTNDFALRKTLEQARGYSLAQLASIYQRLLETDVSIKTGRWGGEIALDLLITNLCSTRGGAT